MTNISPRARFQSDANRCKAWQAWVDSSEFQTAIEAALVQTQFNLPVVSSSDPHACAANHHRMDGARQFAAILLNLADKQPLPAARPTGNLNEAA